MIFFYLSFIITKDIFWNRRGLEISQPKMNRSRNYSCRLFVEECTEHGV